MVSVCVHSYGPGCTQIYHGTYTVTRQCVNRCQGIYTVKWHAHRGFWCAYRCEMGNVHRCVLCVRMYTEACQGMYSLYTGVRQALGNVHR